MPINTELYFIHGWGFDNNVWKNWLPFIQSGITVYNFNRGYFASEKKEFKFNLSARFKILVVHSYGLHYLTPIDFQHIHLLILIGGFRQFHECSSNTRLSKKQISLMKEKLSTDPNSVINNFYNRCGLAENYSLPLVINRETLYEDLLNLDTHQVELDHLKSIPQVLLLHGMADQIVNASHSQKLKETLPNSKLFIHNDEGHALPFTKTDWCINTIKSHLNKKYLFKP